MLLRDGLTGAAVMVDVGLELVEPPSWMRCDDHHDEKHDEQARDRPAKGRRRHG